MMATEVGVLIVHGMGSQEEGFADGMIDKLNDRLGDRAGNVRFEQVLWAPVLSGREDNVWNVLSAQNKLDWVELRRFFLNAFGDASAYRYVPDEPDSIYFRIHDKVRDGLAALRAQLGGDSKTLIVCAHSLGAVIMSNYIWDRQQGKDAARYGETPFGQMESLAGLITFGSNIPLFVLAYDPIECITFPPSTLSAELKAKANWLNLYDKDDILGWPLKELSPAFTQAVMEDREINVGGIFTSWNPLSHSEYWTDGNFIGPVAEFIGSFV
jgi:pimeloyl-ACP methyl ester carboxylesterase